MASSVQVVQDAFDEPALLLGVALVVEAISSQLQLAVLREQRRATDECVAKRPEEPVQPNPWDAGSAKVLAWLGFEALATTSGGFAVTVGRRDGSIGRDAAVAHAAAIVEAAELPVSADFENAFADDPGGVAETVRLGIQAGLAGCSVEDYTGRDEHPFYELAEARERIVAAAEAAHGGPVRLALTARAENHLRGATI
jgi:2-methylisocitrate lyase-like PEP mutase family enzyme